jgi:hypothetical protein
VSFPVASQPAAASAVFHPVEPASAKLQPVPPEPVSPPADAAAVPGALAGLLG